MSRSKKTMPPDVKTLFEDLKSEVALLHARWILYRQLYGINSERIELLNATAAHFFRQLQMVLLDDVILALSRLIDPRSQKGRTNLVLAQLTHSLSSGSFGNLIANLDQRLIAIKAKSEPFRKHRNRRIAHRDLKTAQRRVVQDPLPGISRAMIEDALLEIRGFMNEVQGFFEDSETAYGRFITTSGGDTLIFALKRAYEYEKLRAQGTIPRDHLQKSKYWTV